MTVKCQYLFQSLLCTKEEEPKMEIRQLEYFRAIVDAGTISAAARNLHMTQPPLSYQMKLLEEELQVKLFVRGTRNITLTEAGKALYVRAGSLLMMADVTRREVIKVSRSATLHIGMTPSTVEMMVEKIAAFTYLHPEIHFDIHEGSTFTLKDELENGVVDVTTLRTPITLNGFATAPLVKEPLVAMGLPEKLPEAGSIVLEQLSKEHLILSHRYRAYMLEGFERAGLSCDIYYECEDARTAMTLAQSGVGIAILPSSMRHPDDPVQACTISGAAFRTEILLAWREEKLPEIAREFVRMVLGV